MRSARKHIGWYLADLPGADTLLPHIMTLDSTAQQSDALRRWFDERAADATLPPTPSLH